MKAALGSWIRVAIEAMRVLKIASKIKKQTARKPMPPRGVLYFSDTRESVFGAYPL